MRCFLRVLHSVWENQSNKVAPMNSGRRKKDERVTLGFGFSLFLGPFHLKEINIHRFVVENPSAAHPPPPLAGGKYLQEEPLHR